MNVMPAPSSQHQWYLARDGQQYGPLSDPELAKFVELGHLQASDLLWREGFPDWRPALSVFPAQNAGAAGRKETTAKPAGAPSSAALPPAAERANGNAAALAESDDDVEPHRRGFVARFLKTVVLVVLLLAGVWFAWTWRTELSKLIGAI